MTIKKGKRIKKIREAAGLSQVELAEKIGVSKQTLYKYENDIVTNIPSDKIEAMAAVLDVDPTIIMGWEKPSEISDTSDDTLEWYLDPKAAEIAQQILDDPKLRALFDTARRATPEDLDAMQVMMEALLRKERRED